MRSRSKSSRSYWEIALGPADRVVSAVPQRRTTPITPTVPKTPRVVELLRKAIQAFLESGEATSQAEVARREGLPVP